MKKNLQKLIVIVSLANLVTACGGYEPTQDEMGSMDTASSTVSKETSSSVGSSPWLTAEKFNPSADSGTGTFNKDAQEKNKDKDAAEKNTEEKKKGAKTDDTKSKKNAPETTAKDSSRKNNSKIGNEYKSGVYEEKQDHRKNREYPEEEENQEQLHSLIEECMENGYYYFVGDIVNYVSNPTPQECSEWARNQIERLRYSIDGSLCANEGDFRTTSLTIVCTDGAVIESDVAGCTCTAELKWDCGGEATCNGGGPCNC